MLIAIPSKGRAGITKSDKLIKSGVLFVPENEEKQYKKYGGNIIAVPGDVQGITQTRNWILKNSDDERVVFIDDDVKTCGWIKLYSDRRKNKKLSEIDWLIEFEKLFEICDNLKYYIWGVSTESAARSVYPYKPLLFRSYITASCMGIINDGKYLFDESYRVKEDYEICLRHIVNEGGILAARYLYWENEHWINNGGCKDYRTQSMELEAIRKLIKQYPGIIRKVTKGGSEYSIQLDF